MASLISPGVSVTLIDESFYIPSSAPTVPLFFIATRKNKMQPNGVTPAGATYEHSTVRTVTSLGQSIQLYGVPAFRNDVSGNEYHGDARNEYGLFALNQFLGVGNRAYVVRANIDLSDETTTFISAGTPVSGDVTRVGTGNGTIAAIAAPSQMVRPETISVVMSSATQFTVIGSDSGTLGAGTVGAAFSSSIVSFTVNAGTTPFVAGDYFQFELLYQAAFAGVGNGELIDIATTQDSTAETITVTFTSASIFDVAGSVSGSIGTGTLNVPFTASELNFTAVAGTVPFVAGDVFTVNLASVSIFNPLGANDAARRASIVTALQAEINSNTEVRSEIYEYNLILCPGYHEVVDELVALSNDVLEEAMVIADTPVDKTPEQVPTWSLTSARVQSQNAAYYYPWGLASNLDGRNVCVAPSGIALRTYAYSDNQSYIWFAPAGVNRGRVTGVSQVGYVSGTLGSATTFVEANLNIGQRDGLYESFRNINPIVQFPGRGLLVWGQKTSSPVTSALDRVNVIRLVMFLRRQLRKGSFPFVFEPNDKVTRDNIKSMADGLLNDVLTKRGLYDFATLCDESNNTPFRIDNNELYLEVAIKPTKVAEFVHIPLRVLSTGAEIS
jgi:hypothetical protein